MTAVGHHAPCLARAARVAGCSPMLALAASLELGDAVHCRRLCSFYLFAVPDRETQQFSISTGLPRASGEACSAEPSKVGKRGGRRAKALVAGWSQEGRRSKAPRYGLPGGDAADEHKASPVTLGAAEKLVQDWLQPTAPVDEQGPEKSLFARVGSNPASARAARHTAYADARQRTVVAQGMHRTQQVATCQATEAVVLSWLSRGDAQGT